MEEKRLTRIKDGCECRANLCPMEDYLDLLGDAININNLSGRIAMSDAWICESCPFEKYINKLAEFEDAAELK